MQERFNTYGHVAVSLTVVAPAIQVNALSTHVSSRKSSPRSFCMLWKVSGLAHTFVPGIFCMYTIPVGLACPPTMIPFMAFETNVPGLASGSEAAPSKAVRRKS